MPMIPAVTSLHFWYVDKEHFPIQAHLTSFRSYRIYAMNFLNMTLENDRIS